MDSGVDRIAGTYVQGSRQAALRYAAVPATASIVAPLADLHLTTTAEHALAHSERSERAMRILNFSVAVIALILLSPVFIVIGLIIKFTSPGPVTCFPRNSKGCPG